MDELSKNRTGSCPDISQKLNRYLKITVFGLVIQKSVQLMPQKIENSKKKLDEFSRNDFGSVRIIEISKNFLDEFSMICQ